MCHHALHHVTPSEICHFNIWHRYIILSSASTHDSSETVRYPKRRNRSVGDVNWTITAIHSHSDINGARDNQSRGTLLSQSTTSQHPAINNITLFIWQVYITHQHVIHYTPHITSNICTCTRLIYTCTRTYKFCRLVVLEELDLNGSGCPVLSCDVIILHAPHSIDENISPEHSVKNIPGNDEVNKFNKKEVKENVRNDSVLFLACFGDTAGDVSVWLLAGSAVPCCKSPKGW